MVEIKTAVEAAMKFAADTLGPNRTVDLRLEEVESGTENGQEVWLITLSAPNLGKPGPMAALAASTLSDFLGANAQREYKIFAVSKTTGTVLSMKIRLLAVPTTR